MIAMWHLYMRSSRSKFMGLCIRWMISVLKTAWVHHQLWRRLMDLQAEVSKQWTSVIWVTWLLTWLILIFVERNCQVMIGKHQSVYRGCQCNIRVPTRWQVTVLLLRLPRWCVEFRGAQLLVHNWMRNIRLMYMQNNSTMAAVEKRVI